MTVTVSLSKDSLKEKWQRKPSKLRENATCWRHLGCFWRQRPQNEKLEIYIYIFLNDLNQMAKIKQFVDNDGQNIPIIA